MRVSCPHCRAEYNVDDRRVPPTGLKVKCPKCQKAFPIRPRPEVIPAAPPPAPAPISSAARAAAAPAAPVAHRAATPPPAPSARSALPLPAPAAAPPPPPAPDPAPAPPHTAVNADAAEQDPFSESAAEPFVAGVPDPFAIIAAPPPVPMDPPPAADPPPPIAFGEVDLPHDADPAEPAAPEPATVPDDVALADPPLPSAPAPLASSDEEEMEMLFGEARQEASAAPPIPGAYRVRRPSGKIFGPFTDAQIVEMLGKGELLGNEDVRADGVGTWAPMGSVPAFADAVRRFAAQPERVAHPPPPARRRDWTAPGEREDDAPPATAPRRWFAVAAAALAGALLVAGIGGTGAALHKGWFFWRALRGGDTKRAAALVEQARAALAVDTFTAEKRALELAGQALSAAPEDRVSRTAYVLAAFALDRRHGAPAPALARAREEAARLADDAPGDGPAALAALAIALAAPGGPALRDAEAAAERAFRARPDPEAMNLLGIAALARKDGARAAQRFAELEAAQPRTARAAHGAGLAAVASGAPDPKPFELALERDPSHLASRLELAALAEAAGDIEGARGHLAAILTQDAQPALGPAERARALALQATILGRRVADAAQADATFEAAIAADGRSPTRAALAALRLRRGDAAGALRALDPFGAAVSDDAEVAALRAHALVLAGRALDATALAEQALAKLPGDPRLLEAKAFVLESAGKVAEAARVYEDAAARAPRAWEPRLALGRIALAQGERDRASAELAAAVEKGPARPETHSGLGDLRLAQGDLAGAEAAYQRALELDPEHAPALLGVARVALARGDVAFARARIERALTIEPRNADAQLAYGTLLWRARDLEAAEKAFRAAADLQPKLAIAHARLGAVRLERGDADGAVASLTTAVNLDARAPEAQHWLGRALLAKGETTQAAARLREAVRLDPRDAPSQLWLGVALEKASVTDAIEAYKAASALDPGLAEAHLRLGDLWAANGRCDQAVPCYERAIAAAPKAIAPRIAVADCRARQGKYDEAIRGYREVMKADPSAVQVDYKLARAVHESRGIAAAVPWYERAAREEKGNAMAHYYLGYWFKQRAQRGRAVQEFRAYLAQRPDADDRKDIEAEIDDLGAGR